MKVFRTPDFRVAVEAIRDGIRNGELIILIGSVKVDYYGRARSKLGVGERLVILKPDGVLLIHRPRGHSPVNWQPSGSRFEVKCLGDALILDAERSAPLERVTLIFDRIELLILSKLRDKAEFSLYVDEHDIRDAIVLEPELLEEGFRVITKEKRLPSGFVDLFGVDKDGRLTVVEIKKGVAGKEAILQLKRYVNALKGEEEADIRGIVLASGLARGCQSLIESLGLEFKRVNPRKCHDALLRHGRIGLQADLSKWFSST